MDEERTGDAPALSLQAPDSGKKEARGRDWAVFCHLSALVGFLGLPFGCLLAPLVVWLIKRDEYPFLDDQGREALNWQLSVVVYQLCALLLFCCLVGFAALPALKVLNFVFILVAAVNAGQGKAYRYPLAIRFLR
jgi:hypothetical protein